MTEALKLGVWFGESDRSGGRLLSDALLDAFERHGLHAAVLLRGVEGFGPRAALRSDRFLTLSEDLPLTAMAVDDRGRMEEALPDLATLFDGGLVTLERALLASDLAAAELPGPAKLTLYLGRDERAGGRPAFVAAVDHLRRQGVAGATVLLGLDGMAHGERRRARFFARNRDVPLVVVAVGAHEAVGAALPGLAAMLRDPLATIERVQVCKRDGELLERPPAGDAWQRLTVYASEQSRHAGRPLAPQLVRRLREAGASGATTLRGVWGFSGEHAAHGDRLLHVRRRVPLVTTVVDRAESVAGWFALVDELTDEAGLVTCERVPELLSRLAAP